MTSKCELYTLWLPQPLELRLKKYLRGYQGLFPALAASSDSNVCQNRVTAKPLASICMIKIRDLGIILAQLIYIYRQLGFEKQTNKPETNKQMLKPCLTTTGLTQWEMIKEILSTTRLGPTVFAEGLLKMQAAGKEEGDVLY